MLAEELTYRGATAMQSAIIGQLSLRIFVFFLGLLLVLPALNKLYTYYNYRYLGSMTYGVIDHPSSGRDIGGRPLIQYRDPAGRVHEFKSKAKTHWFYAPKKGEKIKVFIHKNDTQKAIVNSMFHYVFLPLILFATGSCFCLYAIFQKKDRFRATGRL